MFDLIYSNTFKYFIRFYHFGYSDTYMRSFWYEKGSPLKNGRLCQMLTNRCRSRNFSKRSRGGGGNWKFGAWHEVHVHHSLKPRSGVHIGWRGSYIIGMVCDAGSTVAHLGLQNFFSVMDIGSGRLEGPKYD